MIPAAFSYAAPTSIEDAIALLQEHGDDAKLLAGGHSLLPLMKLRLALPSFVIDLSRVPALSYVREDGNHVAIGAMTTYDALQSSPVVKSRVPILSTAAAMVGDVQVRNRGTIGGSLAHADPASDLPAVITALRGTVVVQGPAGSRSIEAEEFFEDVWTSALEPDEVITEIRVPAPAGTAQTYQKFRQRSADWAIVGTAVAVACADGKISDASIVLTNVGSTPIRARAAEEALRNQVPSVDVIDAAAARAEEGLNPSDELRASAEYKRHLTRILTRRSLQAVLLS